MLQIIYFLDRCSLLMKRGSDFKTWADDGDHHIEFQGPNSNLS